MQDLMSGTIKEEYPYDTFISYHDADKQWVTETLIRSLEDQGIKVCWDDRDFEVGKTVIDNQVDAICSSATTIAVLSPEYSENEQIWLLLSNLTGLKNEDIFKKFLIIPIIYRVGKISDIFKPIWKLDWTNQAARKFFWTKLLQSIKKGRDCRHGGTNAFRIEKPNLEIQKEKNNAATFKYTLSDIGKVKVRKSVEQTTQSKILETKTSCTPVKSTDKQNPEEERPKVLDGQNPMDYNADRIRRKKNHRGKEKEVEKIKTVDILKTEGSPTHEDTLNFSSKKQAEDLMLNSQKNYQNFCENETKAKESEPDSFLVNYNVFDDTENQNKDKLMESINPRILSLFVPEDDDLSRQDIEELTFRIEDALIEEEEVKPVEKPEKCYPKFQMKNNNKSKANEHGALLENFVSPKEQMHFLDMLQQRETEIRLKFQKCCDVERKKTYRRLLERFDQAILYAVNGRKDKELLLNLPIPEDSFDEARGCQCPCCDRVFHSERAKNMHTEHCVKLTWKNLLM